MKLRNFTLSLAVFSLNASADDAPAQVICTSQSVICAGLASPKDRFDPLVQRVLVTQQLADQPKGYQLIYFYVPVNVATEALAELQIRFMNELIARQRAAETEKAAEEKVADDDPK